MGLRALFAGAVVMCCLLSYAATSLRSFLPRFKSLQKELNILQRKRAVLNEDFTAFKKAAITARVEDVQEGLLIFEEFMEVSQGDLSMNSSLILMQCGVLFRAKWVWYIFCPGCLVFVWTPLLNASKFKQLQLARQLLIQINRSNKIPKPVPATRIFRRPLTMSKQTYSVCFCFRRRFHLAEAETPAEIRSIFNQYSENGVMSVANLHRFLIEIHHDMNSPLSHYFIYTGHNSYLTGNQLSSDCSDAPIIQALQRGVRVIELDIWPNKTKNIVDVLHGRTLTTPVALSKCLKSIKEYAFSASEYPLIITLEDHLTPDLQAKVAQMIKQTFGDMLYSPGTECLKEFPSPESLKKRVIISTKPPKEYQQTKEVKEKTTKESSSAVTEAWGE
ncbi:unnamed protein product [Cuscuta campestris]|uniref:Phosphoinositide phospholipase C n=1 Tax=Cuscuta campestris TaxID=132261 RepID=A0A484LVJ9_9ASTE|nr:unnamed protein product [Cuscuta campestris]